MYDFESLFFFTSLKAFLYELYFGSEINFIFPLEKKIFCNLHILSFNIGLRASSMSKTAELSVEIIVIKETKCKECAFCLP